MWFEDLASLAGDERLVTVGWLARDRPYARGSVDPGVSAALAAAAPGREREQPL